MKRMGLLLSLSIGGMLLVEGCTSSRPPLLNPGMSPVAVMRAIEERNNEIRSLRGYGQISVDTPELSNSGSISVTLSRPDSLLVDISGPFGVGVAKGLVTRSDFRFYNGLENKVFVGKTTPANIHTVFRIPIVFSDIMDLFSGCMSFTGAPSGIVPTGTWEENEYLLTFETGEETLEYRIDAGYESIIRFTRRTSDGILKEEIRFKDFRRSSDYYLPHIITVQRPGSDQSLTLLYERQVINEYPLDFTMKIPRTAVKIKL